MQKPVIVVHGGAGTWQPERKSAGLAGVKEAAAAGFDVLRAGGSALDAVESAVVTMENNEIFNAGHGSTLTIDKRIEMEASIMDGKTLNAGAVGLLRNIKNPTRLARIIMEKTDHVFIIGEGAEKLAGLFKLEIASPFTELRRRYWAETMEKLMRGDHDYLPKLHKLAASNPQLFDLGTVGAAALDKDENLAAATSTGGFSLKFPGRIGDSPLIGCGTYADNEAGASSTTGIGEIAVKLVLAKNACDSMRNGETAQEAAESSIRLVNRRMSGGSMGLITLDVAGRIGAAHNSRNLCWAYMTPKTRHPKTALTARIVEETT
ncbi:MAG: isoaspartyl peptidase/L-asparaginase [Candidatus Bathyarchaeota archaeon]|nr:MAG: isoaspartyl peptidase/L-asparaginase [Candidatus Bathyarchaeota archaeon]